MKGANLVLSIFLTLVALAFLGDLIVREPFWAFVSVALVVFLLWAHSETQKQQQEEKKDEERENEKDPIDWK